jgi:hypothetical protein
MTALDYVQGEAIDMPQATEYEAFLEELQLLGHGFSYKELVRPRYRDFRGRFRPPPSHFWARMVPTLAAANDLRRIVCNPDGNIPPVGGLRIAAAFRPKGGAGRSQHKFNAALDLDLLPTDAGQARRFYREAVKLWSEYGRPLKMGLGLYCSSRSRGGIRVHIDTGYRCRTWQISGGKSLRPYFHEGRRVPLAINIANELGLALPNKPSEASSSR